MKSKEEISRRLKDLNESSNSIEKCYLAAALKEDKLYLKNLWCKYTLELKDDIEILKVLEWVLEDDATFNTK